MSITEIKKYLENIKKNYLDFCKSKDEQTLFYINQMIDLFYSELLEEFKVKTNLHGLVYSLYKKNLNIIFSNLEEYTSKISDNAIKNIDSIINLSATNRYLNMYNISGVFVTFSNEVNKSFTIDRKINILIKSNTNTFTEALFSKMNIESKDAILKIIKKYQDIILKEMISNVLSKRDTLLKYYKEFIDTVMSDSYDRRDEVREKNLEMINEVTYLCLKDMEYININKYIDVNDKYIKEVVDLFLNELVNFKIIRKKNKSNSLKDYLLSFNNTIGVKAKKIFDEMNDIVYLNKDDAGRKLRDFNDALTHVFEKDIVIDRQFDKLRKELGVSSRDVSKYNELSKVKNRALTEVMKANVFNIFRENSKVYNDIVYRSLTLKNKVDEFGSLLSSSQIKELLIKK